MEAIYLLIPVAVILVGVIVAGFMWAVRSGQFDDLEGPAHSILMDDDEPPRGDDLENHADPEDSGKGQSRENTENRAGPKR